LARFRAEAAPLDDPRQFETCRRGSLAGQERERERGREGEREREREKEKERERERERGRAGERATRSVLQKGGDNKEKDQVEEDVEEG